MANQMYNGRTQNREGWNNNRNGNNKPGNGQFYPRRQREIKVTNLMKSFSSFEEGYTEMIKLFPDIKTYGGETPLYASVIGNILNSIKDDIPSLQNSKYPNTFSFSIDSHEVGLKTGSDLAFGWRSYFDRDAGKVVYKFRITFITLNNYKRNTIRTMEEAEWKSGESTLGGRTRFWDSVESRGRGRRGAVYAPIINQEEEQQVAQQSAETVKEQITFSDNMTISQSTEEDISNKEYNPDMVAQFQKAGYTLDMAQQNDPEPSVQEENNIVEPEPQAFSIDIPSSAESAPVIQEENIVQQEVQDAAEITEQSNMEQ